MHDQAARLAGDLVTVDRELDREFEARLVESSTLAFRVAYGVLRHRQSTQFSTATDKVSGEVVKIDVTLTVVK